jgi:phosphoribosylformylglycinamidine cyclo-ligase
MGSQSESNLSYSDSGVDIDAGNRLVDRIRPLAKNTMRPGVMESLGGFGAMFEIPPGKFRNPVLVSGTDGVGTKLKIANMLDRHDTIGIDLVAMCVNDIVVCGAEPLYFLDYFATSKLELDQAEAVVKGIAQGCLEAGCALIGGETAEMPGLYNPGEYDLAGFAVGAVEKDGIISPERVKAGDTILGLASSGFHSNGYSLIRKVIEMSGADLYSPFDDSTLGEKLLVPTRIYVSAVLACNAKVRVSAVSHITGGGITENLPRVLPHGLAAKIDIDSWPVPAVFRWLQDNGNIATAEMYRTFNCGIGMIVCVPPDEADNATESLTGNGENVYVIGEIVESGESRVILQGPDN